MRRLLKKLKELSPASLAVLVVLAACGGQAIAKEGLDKVDEIMNQGSTKAMLPDPGCLPNCSIDFKNYNKSAERSQDPNTVQYCTFYPATPGVRPVTIPIVGSMTSSSVSFYPSSRSYKPGDGGTGEFTPERRSFDGMYHGSPPPYRFGFDPISDARHSIGGDLGWWCVDTPQPSQIHDTTLNVTLVTEGEQLTEQINAALRRGDRDAATAAVGELANLR